MRFLPRFFQSAPSDIPNRGTFEALMYPSMVTHSQKVCPEQAPSTLPRVISLVLQSRRFFREVQMVIFASLIDERQTPLVRDTIYHLLSVGPSPADLACSIQL